ncbi:6-phosphogluconolactonase [Labrys monachus]|uniref:6-phosphogluconolactonase n=1 Tax=Labrys monachus TaxID=217067 RepID=A0ABU0FEU2_9HYPH|nr:6-phosphogluconolactonase [Labrys monachus]MDQ0393133.1 6-phosphogluconolactonase [Labrys monachus]
MDQERILDVAADAETLADRAADWFVAEIAARPGPIAVALSGGSTPKRLYERLARDPWRSALPFDRIHWFWGDERIVPEGDDRRNALMARHALLDHVPVPPANIHAIAADPMAPEDAALAYEAELKRFYRADLPDPARPLFDVMLLGIGSDGHTASLFPGKPSLEVTDRWAVASEPGLEPFVPRVTLTFSAIASSRAVAFLASGADKRLILERVFAGADLPSGRVACAGPVHWFLDEAAMPR